MVAEKQPKSNAGKLDVRDFQLRGGEDSYVENLEKARAMANAESRHRYLAIDARNNAYMALIDDGVKYTINTAVVRGGQEGNLGYRELTGIDAANASLDDALRWDKKATEAGVQAGAKYDENVARDAVLQRIYEQRRNVGREE